jgi:hypothetical protein
LNKKGELTDMGAYYMGDPATGVVPSSASGLAVFAGWSVCLVAVMFFNFA